MSPRNTSVTQGQPAIESHSKGVQKNWKLFSPKKNTRPQALLSPIRSAINSIHPNAIQEPSADPQTLSEPLPPTGQKPGYDSEDERSNKRLRKELTSLSESSQPLTKANLAELNRLTGSEASDKMNSEVRTPERGGRKRLWRQLSMTDMTSEAASVPSQRSSGTAAHYRFNVLESARIIVRSGPPPKEIQPRINTAVQREISKERKRELSDIARKLCNDLTGVINGGNREDCVIHIHNALNSMDSGKSFAFPRNADWDPSLKPIIRQQLDFSFLKKSEVEADDDAAQPRNQQQPDAAYLSPYASKPVMQPLPPKRGISHVKTPRPNITAGLRHSTIVEALVARGPSKDNASDFLRSLQDQQLLCSDPTQSMLSVRFPPLVVECKAYATGKPVFEAQNQASVSGSCMANLQHKLADLTKSASPGFCYSKAPLAFSICTEGPYMELWVHYTTLEDNVRMYNMNILKICHVSIPEGVAEFLAMVNNVMSWATVDFVEDIAEQLVLVMKATQEGQLIRQSSGPSYNAAL